jgi:hypothetical protein
VWRVYISRLCWCFGEFGNIVGIAGASVKEEGRSAIQCNRDGKSSGIYIEIGVLL